MASAGQRGSTLGPPSRWRPSRLRRRRPQPNACWANRPRSLWPQPSLAGDWGWALGLGLGWLGLGLGWLGLGLGWLGLGLGLGWLGLA